MVNAVAVSAPGKVLLAGGYLVLDRAYTGLVFALDARIHVVINPIPTRNGVVLSEIVVASPQFDDAVWEYGYRLLEGGGGMEVVPLRVDADHNLNRNVFIETTLTYALSYISSVASPVITPSSITILADNDYYSHPSSSHPPSSPSPSSKPTPFHSFGVKLHKAHKTGLGSSAALVTSLTASLLTFYLPSSTFNLSSEPSQRLLHNLSQTAHCAAQGKVGSGFDVASAVYGSCLYRRFSPSILSSAPEPGSKGFAKALRELVDETGGVGKWDTEISRDAVKVPKGLRLVMCDVSTGSQTPGMVKKVLAWRKANMEEAEAIWTVLHAANERLARELKAWADGTGGGLERVKVCLREMRSGLREMSEASGVPIEPAEQTRLIDACEGVDGVVGGVVPGAGGFDAVSLLIEEREETVRELERVLAGWKFGEDGRVRMLGVREEMEGVRREEGREYEAWLP